MSTKSITEIIIEKQHERGSVGLKHGYDEYCASVRLANAAPDLLEAAKHAAMEWRLHGQLTDSCRVLEAAIRKAEGREGE